MAGAPRARCSAASPPPTAVCSERRVPRGCYTEPVRQHMRRSTTPQAGTTACPREHTRAGRHTRHIPHLTILYLAQRATILSCDAHGVLPLFAKARLIEHQHAIGLAHRVSYELMVIPLHL